MSKRKTKSKIYSSQEDAIRNLPRCPRPKGGQMDHWWYIDHHRLKESQNYIPCVCGTCGQKNETQPRCRRISSNLNKRIIMGYFPNGSSADSYKEQYCSRCLHGKDEDCPIWLLHFRWNYEQLKEEGEQKRMVLSLFIPRTKDGLGNQQCKMFTANPKKL